MKIKKILNNFPIIYYMPKKPTKKPVRKPTTKKTEKPTIHNVNNIHIHSTDKKPNNKRRRRQNLRKTGGALTSYSTIVNPTNIIPQPHINRPQYADNTTLAQREQMHHLGNYMNPNIIGHPPVTNPINFTPQVPISNTNQMKDQTPVTTGIPATPVKGTIANKPKPDSFDRIYEESELNPMHPSNRNRPHSSPSSRERTSPNQPLNLPRPRNPAPQRARRDIIPQPSAPLPAATQQLTGVLQAALTPKQGRPKDVDRTDEEKEETKRFTEENRARKAQGLSPKKRQNKGKKAGGN
jgi:hypothetical protein